MNVTRETRNCPFCLHPVGPDEDKVRCPKCGVVHHADCWKANGRCSVYGCDGWAAWSEGIAEKIAPATEDAVVVDGTPKQAASKVTRCIRCGAEVGPRDMLCWNCRKIAKRYWFENCFGPAVIILGGIVILVRTLLT